MKTYTKLIIAGATIGFVVAGALIAKHFISVNKENHAVQIIGGADGPTSVFLAGKISADRKHVGMTPRDGDGGSFLKSGVQIG